LGFHLDPRSEQLIEGALPLLKRVSGDRIRHELELIFREDEPERALCRLDELDALSHVHPGLQCDHWLKAKYRALRERLDPEIWEFKSDDMLFVHLALLAYRLEEEGLQALSKRLKVKRDHGEDLLLVRDLRQRLPELAGLSRPSATYRLLQPYPARVLAVNWIATERETVQGALFSYQVAGRLVEPEITGDDLKAMGLEPGPLFGQLLSVLRDARLDGEVGTRQEEMAVVETMLGPEDQPEEDG
jgi:tRNA nucleotidyltransferase (CCA-adding enzyme)